MIAEIAENDAIKSHGVTELALAAKLTTSRAFKSTILNIGLIHQLLAFVNSCEGTPNARNGRFLRFFKTGTRPAKCKTTSEMTLLEEMKERKYPMFINSETSNRFAAGLFAVVISALFMATAIVPASPNGFIV